MTKLSVNIIYGNLKPSEPIVQLVGNHTVKAQHLQMLLAAAVETHDGIKSDGDKRTIIESKIKELTEAYQSHIGTYN